MAERRLNQYTRHTARCYCLSSSPPSVEVPPRKVNFMSLISSTDFIFHAKEVPEYFKTAA